MSVELLVANFLRIADSLSAVAGHGVIVTVDGAAQCLRSLV